MLSLVINWMECTALFCMSVNGVPFGLPDAHDEDVIIMDWGMLMLDNSGNILVAPMRMTASRGA